MFGRACACRFRSILNGSGISSGFFGLALSLACSAWLAQVAHAQSPPQQEAPDAPPQEPAAGALPLQPEAAAGASAHEETGLLGSEEKQAEEGATAEKAAEPGSPAAMRTHRAADESAALAEIERVAATRKAREGQFIGDTQDATSAATSEDLPPGADAESLDTFNEVAAYDLTWQITPHAWLRPEGMLQLRETLNHRAQTGEGRKLTIGYTIPRARLMLWVGVTDYLRFRIRLGAKSGGSIELEQGFADLALGPVTLRAGRFYLPIYGGGASPANLLTSVDYSFASNYLDGGNTQGISFAIGAPRVRAHLYLNDGLRTGFAEFGKQINADAALTARVDAQPLTEHDWTRFDEFSSFRGSDFALRVGVAGHAQFGGGTGETANLDYFVTTADLQIEGDGWHVMTAGGWVHMRPRDLQRINNFAYEVQTGYFFLEPLELWASYDALIPDKRAPQLPGMGTGFVATTLHTLSGGLCYYIVPRAHRAKLQAQFDYVFGAIDTSLLSPSANDGLLSSSAGNQWIARVQLALAF